MKNNKKEIKEAMDQIAQRKPGNSRLVYDKATKSIVAVSRNGKIVKSLNISSEEADFI